jgi:two-component system, NarL family, sensor histidine kinase UhpB
MALIWRLFAANALVLGGAALVLVLAPVSVSRSAELGEVLILCAGLAVALTVNLVLLRRTLAPLRALTELMGTIDLRRPGLRLPIENGHTPEVTALAREFNGMLERLENERRESARLALAAQEDERQRIAREIHDQVGQTLTAVTIQAERAAEMDDPVDRRLLDQIARTALQSLEDVRRIGRELRPEALDDLGLGNALITLCRRLANQSGVRIGPSLAPGLPGLRPEVELVVYRVAQEAITNALRHAGASQIALALSCSNGDVVLSIRDDGCGLPGEPPEDSAGISGMRERALLVGGALTFRSEPGGGTEVHLAIPSQEAAA